jgi:GrpB-like predicted nucleotidyltransferase (UPF0157 family)
MPAKPDPGTILIVDYDPAWPELFENEKSRILEAVAAHVTEVHHVGSTAVPGLASKPIIDVMIGLRAHADGELTIAPLESIGYVYRGDAGIPGRYYFRKPTDSPAPGQTFDGVGRTHHIHMYEMTHPEWSAHLRFRDFLRNQPATIERYAALKRELAAKHPQDRVAYGEAKTPFIQVVLGRARGGDFSLIRVDDYNPAWPRHFEEARDLLRRALGDAILEIQHVGSTAVPGLAAKPIIDIMIAVPDLDRAREQCVRPLANLGFDYVPEFEAVMPYRLYFRKGIPRTHHIHMVQPDGEFWERHLLFRDYLRKHPAAVAEYAALKKRLAEEHGSDMDGYTEAKSDFIRGIEQKARELLAGP